MSRLSSVLPFSLVATFLLLFLPSTLFSFSHASDHLHFPPSQTLPTSEWWVDEQELFDGEVSSRSKSSRRLTVEGPSSEPVDEQYPLLALASQRTRRKDPLNGFDMYAGGWNLKDHHYWASVGFTAAPLFAIAAAWFLGFGICLLVIFLCYFFTETKTYDYSQKAYALSLIFLLLFTIAAIIGCVVLYTGQKKFHTSTFKTLGYVIHQADSTVEKLTTVSDYLTAAKRTAVDQVFLPANVQTDIDIIGAKINSTARTVSDRTLESSDDIKHLLDSIRLSLIIVAAIALVLSFLGLLFSILGMQLLVYILVITGWIVVTGTFLVSGTFLMLHNVAGDTCVAMNEWVQNPSAHTALDDILTCVDNSTAEETILRSKEVSSQLVDLVNQVLTNVSNINFSPNFKPMYFNQSGPLVPLLCNPFRPDFTDRSCDSTEVDLRTAPEVWENYVCKVTDMDICITTGRLTPTLYDQMIGGVNISYALFTYGPSLVELEDCGFARSTFNEIFRDQCPGLMRYSRWVYVGLVIVSTAVMLSLIFWVIYGRERQHRLYGKNTSKEAVKGGTVHEEFEGDKQMQHH